MLQFVVHGAFSHAFSSFFSVFRPEKKERKNTEHLFNQTNRYYTSYLIPSYPVGGCVCCRQVTRTKWCPSTSRVTARPLQRIFECSAHFQLVVAAFWRSRTNRWPSCSSIWKPRRVVPNTASVYDSAEMGTGLKSLLEKVGSAF